ncbi:MAG: GDSL-type esterase/lipase family protein [Verrucomicrobia bacterium]|nr:GDSL-type esterase/lipase family protein [Verrucomicrobiota bacterium]
MAAAEAVRIEVINAGLSGETSAGGLRRVQWVLRRQMDVFVLALGANDGLRGLPAETTLENLRGIIQAVKDRQPSARIILAGMLAPPNMGPEYSADFSAVFSTLATEFNLPLILFYLRMSLATRPSTWLMAFTPTHKVKGG